MEDRIINSIKTIHERLNQIYIRANNDYKDLLNRRFTCQLVFFKENYLQVDGQYQLQHYPIPIITVNEIGDIGYNLDMIFFEFAFEKSDFLEIDLSHILNHDNAIEIYGGDDCLADFYQKGDTQEIIREKVQHSYEQNIMMSVYFDYAYDRLIDTFIEITINL